MKALRRSILGIALYLFAFAVPLLPATVYGAPPTPVRLAGKAMIGIREIAQHYNFKITYDGKTVKLDGKYHHFTFTPNKKHAAFNGIVISLSNPVATSGNRFYLSKTDYDTIVLPLVSKLSLKPHNMDVIVLDAGHGGRDVGAEGMRHQEKKLTLKIVSKVYAKLKAAGYNVKLTRSKDVFIALPDRTAKANAAGADLFVSIHVNANRKGNVSGIESYCLTPAGTASSNSPSSQIDTRRFAGNAYDANNFALAYLSHRSMIKNTSAIDRGVKHARFAVLKDIKCPAVLLECGFISNSAEEMLLGSDKYIEKIADGITAGIINYHKALQR